jgi:hypothetical protein
MKTLLSLIIVACSPLFSAELGNLDITPAELGWAQSNLISESKLLKGPFNTVHNVDIHFPNQKEFVCAAFLMQFSKIKPEILKGAAVTFHTITYDRHVENATQGQGLKLITFSDHNQIRWVKGNLVLKMTPPYEVWGLHLSMFDGVEHELKIDDLFVYPIHLVYIGQDPSTTEKISLQRPANQFTLDGKYNWNINIQPPHQISEDLIKAKLGNANVKALLRDEFFRLRNENAIPKNILEANLFQESWGFLRDTDDIYLQETHMGGSGRSQVEWNRFYQVMAPGTTKRIGWIHRIKRHDTSYFENLEEGYRSHGATYQDVTQKDEMTVFEARYDVEGHRIGNHLTKVSERQLVEEGEIHGRNK